MITFHQGMSVAFATASAQGAIHGPPGQDHAPGPWTGSRGRAALADAQALPGRGPAGAVGVMAYQQAAYLTACRALMRKAMLAGSQAGAELSPEERNYLLTGMGCRYPTNDTTANLPRAKLLVLNLGAVRRELGQVGP